LPLNPNDSTGTGAAVVAANDPYPATWQEFRTIWMAAPYNMTYDQAMATWSQIEATRAGKGRYSTPQQAIADFFKSGVTVSSGMTPQQIDQVREELTRAHSAAAAQYRHYEANRGEYDPSSLAAYEASYAEYNKSYEAFMSGSLDVRKAASLAPPAPITRTTTYYATPSGALYPFSQAGQEAAWTSATNVEPKRAVQSEAAFTEFYQGASFGRAFKPITFYPNPPEGFIGLGNVSPEPTPSPILEGTLKPRPGTLGINLENIFEERAQAYRIGASNLMSFGETLKAEGNVGAIPVFIGANLARAGAGAIEAITFPFRPAQWINLGKTIVTPEGRSSFVSAFQKDPMGSIMEMGGGIAGGYVFGRALGEISDIVAGTKTTFVSPEKIEISPVTEPEIDLGGAKIPDYTENVPSLTRSKITPTVAEKTFRTKIPLELQAPDISGMGKNIPVNEPLSGFIGYDIESPVKGASLIEFSPEEIEQIYRGKPFEVTGLKTTSLYLGGEATPEIGVGKLKGVMGESMIVPREDVLNPKIFELKEVGPEGLYGPLGEVKPTPIETGFESFTLKLVAGFKEETPPPETPIYQPPADTIHTPLSELSKVDVKPQKIVSPTPKTGATVAETVSKTGVVVPSTKVSYYPSEYGVEGIAIGVSSGVGVKQPSEARVSMGSALRVKEGVSPIMGLDINEKLAVIPVEAITPVSEQAQRLNQIQLSRSEASNIQPLRVSQIQVAKSEEVQLPIFSQSQVYKMGQPQIMKMGQVQSQALSFPSLLVPPQISKTSKPLPSFMWQKRGILKPKMGLDLFGRKRVTYRELDLPTAVFGRRKK
jgi:hypothetical protein